MNTISTIRSVVDAFRIFAEDRSGKPTDDFAYPPKLIYYLIRNYRNAIVADDMKKKVRTGEDVSLILTLPCVKVRELDQISECPCAPPKGCTFYKSVFPMPRMIGGLPISVTSIDGYVKYDYVSWSQFKEKTTSRVAAQNREPKYTIRTIHNKVYLYVYSSEKVVDPELIAITAYPKDPLEFYQFPKCDETISLLCNPLDEEFLIESELEIRIFEAVMKGLQGYKQVATGSDPLNNDNNDTTTKLA